MKLINRIMPAVITIGMLLIVLLLLSILVTPKNNTEEAGFDPDLLAAYGYEAEPDEVIDVFMLGDSEARTSVSPMKMYHDVGITSYCCGINDGDLSDVKLMLRNILKTRSPKLVILECNVLFKEFDWKKMLINEASFFFPVITWHNRWKSLRADDFMKLPDNTNVQARKGYYYARVVKGAPSYLLKNYMKPDEGCERTGAINTCVLEDIALILRTKKISMLLLSTPSLSNWTMAKHNTCERLASSLNEKAKGYQTGVEYVDMNLMSDVIEIDWSKDTRDKGDHMNNRGMDKVCTWLGPWLKDHYDLDDHRTDPACRETWTGMYDEYLKWI